MKMKWLFMVIFIFFFLYAGCNKKGKKEETKSIETTTVEPSTQTESEVQVDIKKVQAAFDMNAEWSRIETLAQNVDTVALEKLAVKYKFTDALEMLNYVQFAILGGWHLLNKPEQKEEFEREYGSDAVAILTNEKNQKKIVEFVESKRKAQPEAGDKKSK